MTIAQSPPTLSLPDHTQLPESDGTFVFAERSAGKNFQEHPQSILLTSSIRPVLEQLHPDGRYCIGQDSGIYWRLPPVGFANDRSTRARRGSTRLVLCT
jgi:hypothetical protein